MKNSASQEIPQYEFFHPQAPGAWFPEGKKEDYFPHRSAPLPAAEGESEQAFLDQCIASVRELIGVNRIAIFLDSHEESIHSSFSSSCKHLPCVGAIGIPADVSRHSKLSLETGIGKWVTQQERILRRTDAGSILTPNEAAIIQNEFQSLHCHLAIPITDLRNTIGVALLGSPITQRDFSEEELRQIFHLMRKLGTFINESRNRTQLTLDNKVLNQMLSLLHCGALAVDSDLRILKANGTIKDFLGLNQNKRPTFNDIPEVIAAQIRGALAQRHIPAPFFLSLPRDPEKRLLRITLSPLDEETESGFRLLIMVEDFSEVEAAKQAAINTATSRLASHLQLLTSPLS